MKKLMITCLLMMTGAMALHAQQDCQFPMAVYGPASLQEQSPTAFAQLGAKLRQVITHSGMGASTENAEFAVVANLTETNRSLTSGLRPLTTVFVDLDLYVTNTTTGERFHSTAISLTGAGNSVGVAYTAALANINPQNAQLQEFLKKARQRIVEYYDRQAPAIIRKAKNLARLHQYEEAFFLLTGIPTCCSKADEVAENISAIYQQMVNDDCAVKLAKARAAWNASQDREGAEIAGALLAAILPSAKCGDDVSKLSEEIHQRIGEEWLLVKDQYNFQKEMAQKEQEHQHALDQADKEIEKQRIEAARTIGKAFAENQKKDTINHEEYVIVQ